MRFSLAAVLSLALASPVVRRASLAELDTTFFELGANALLADYLEANRQWATEMNATTPQVLKTSGEGQKPHTLLITCSDSRVSSEVFGTFPGEIFEHKNIANVVNANDMNIQAVVQYAVANLEVNKVIVMGHTGCGGVAAAHGKLAVGGVIDTWLQPIRTLRDTFYTQLNQTESEHDQLDMLATFNAAQSAQVVRKLPAVATAVEKRELEVWALVYDTVTGLVHQVELPEEHHPEIYELE